jgi:arsenite methyltransferase
MTKLSRHGTYGIDGNIIGIVLLGVLTVAALVTAALERTRHIGLAAVTAVIATYLVSILGFYLHTTRHGKFIVWAEIPGTLELRGDERVLDVGCGLGAVLTMVGKQTPRGRVVGLDLWTRDQFGNSIAAAARNLAAEGVRDNCELVTGDMQAMPFPDASFDLVVSSLAIHNIRSDAGRKRAVAEIARVLKPGGRVAIADLAWTQTYAQQLEQQGFVDMRRQCLGWRCWWGPAFPTTTLVTGIKP